MADNGMPDAGRVVLPLEAGSTGQHAGSLIRFECHGSNGKVYAPVRGFSVGVDTVRALISGRVNPDLPFLTFRERGVTVVMTLRDMKLSP